MINGLNIFYTKANTEKGLKLIENKGSGSCMTNKIQTIIMKKISNREKFKNFKITFYNI